MVERLAVNQDVTGSSPVAGAGYAAFFMSYYVYILINSKNETYVGQTYNIQQRIDQHNDPDYTGTYGILSS